MKVMKGTLNKKRWGILALLVGVYFLASALTWVSERFLLSKMPTQAGPTKITLRPYLVCLVYLVRQDRRDQRNQRESCMAGF